MSLRFSSQPARGDQPAGDDEDPSFTTGNDGVTTPAEDSELAAPTRPTFTAKSEPVTGTVPEPAPAPDDVVADDAVPDDAVPDDAVPDDVVAEDYAAKGNYAADESVSPAEPAVGPDDGTLGEPDAYPATGAYETTGAYQTAQTANGTHATPATATATATADLDGPLLGDATELRGRWQHVQAGFVDDPQEAVGYAADLIEQTAQALVVALRQRQRELRVEWERRGNGDEPAAATADGRPDTEHLRLIMQRYRGLFNELCRP
jgi:hypothetical protein